MPTGTIARPMHVKGFGFIKPDDGGPDVFMHVNELAGGTEDDLVIGARVSYEVSGSARGPKAVRVRLLEYHDPAESGREMPEGEGDAAAWRAEMQRVVNRHMLALTDELSALFGWGQ